MKKFLLFFAALCCTLLAGAFEVDGINYNITSSTTPYTVEVGNNKSFTGTTVTIPASVTYEDITYSVTSIGKDAFYKCSTLTSVTIPASVTSIGTWAFGWSSLSSVTFAEGSQLTSIEGGAFQQCSSLTSINIPASVTSIDQYAFKGCSSLTDVTVNWTEETKIPTIDANVFENVNFSLVTLHFPDDTQSLYQEKKVWNFFGNFPHSEILYTSSAKIDGLDVSKFGGLDITSHNFENGQGVITFSDDVTSIGFEAFSNCSNLTSITIPNSVESIENDAFYGCSCLTSIILPNSVTSIGERAFRGCSSLTSITIPNSVTSIGNMAFSGCTNLTSIDIPNSVISIGGAFQGCSGLTSVTFAEGSKLENISNAFSGCSNLTSITIPNSVTSIGYNAFRDCSSLTNVTLLSSVTSIEEQVFNGCSGLTNIHIPNSVTSIGMYAFHGCSGLTSINIPNSATSIGEDAFSNCSSLQSVNLQSLPSMGNDIFAFCSNLSSITLDLTDSEKPYIGTSLSNYPEIGFTEANYTRSSALNKWGTIVLPFVPESTTGLEFYALSSMTTGENGGSLTFTKVDEIEAGKPYLFRNTSEKTDFTLTKTSPAVSDFVLTPQDQTADGFSMKGSFQQTQLDGATNTNLYYLSNDQFWHANGKINIAPFRAYIEGSGASVKGFVLMIEDNGTVNAIPGILTEDGDIDETEGIYDLSGRKLDAPRKGQVNIIRTKSGKTVKRMF